MDLMFFQLHRRGPTKKLELERHLSLISYRIIDVRDFEKFSFKRRKNFKKTALKFRVQM